MGNRKFSSLKPSYRVMWPSHHHVQWVLWAYSWRVKRPEGESYKMFLKFKDEEMITRKEFWEIV
jgi:hypothetical protein